MIFSGFLRFASPDPADFQNRPYTSPRVILPLFALLAILLVAPRGLAAPYQGWSLPGADEGGGHFSHATQITPDNVTALTAPVTSGRVRTSSAV